MYIVSLMCQSVNLIWTIAVQIAASFSPTFVVDAKIICGYNYVVPLKGASRDQKLAGDMRDIQMKFFCIS